MTTTTIPISQELFVPAESSSFEGTYNIPVLKAGPDLYDFAEPLSWQVDITNTGGALLVTGTVEGVGRTACARCLEPFDISIVGDVEGYFLIHDEDHPEDDAESDEFSVLGPESTIDLVPLLQAAILVDVPLVPLCRDDCKGLCPDCGINLNEATCGCAEVRAQVDAADKAAVNPFAVLSALSFDADAVDARTASDGASSVPDDDSAESLVDGEVDDDAGSESEWGSALIED